MLFRLRGIIYLLFEVFRYYFFLICNMIHPSFKVKVLINKQCNSCLKVNLSYPVLKHGPRSITFRQE